MSAPVERPQVRPAARPWVAEDLDKIPEDGYRREIIGGMLIVSPAPIGRHQVCAGEVFALLREACPREFRVMPSPYAWRPETGENFEPDVMVIRRHEYNPEGPQRRTPVLVVEVLSPSNQEYDRGLKRAAYERLGVPAYWIVDAKDRELVALRLNSKGRYVEAAAATGKETFKVDFPFPVEFIPADLVEL